MSQLIACRWPGGLVMAADRRVETLQDGERLSHTVQKLFPLGNQAAVATSGAAMGIGVSRVLSRLMQRRGTIPFAELESYALSVFQKEYDEFVRQGAGWFAAHPEAHRRSYVLVGGRRDRGDFTFHLHASEHHGHPYTPLRTQSVLTAPRRIGLEGRLARAAATGEPAEERVLETAIAGMRLISERDDTVAGPFDAVVLSGRGVRWQVFGASADPSAAYSPRAT